MAIKANLKTLAQLVDLGAVLKLGATEAVGVIQRRTARGLDMHGRTFVPYSIEYGAKRADDGRNTSPVDLTLTGGLLAALKILRTEKAIDVMRSFIGPGTGTSPRLEWEFDDHRGYKSRRTGGRGPSHNLVGRWLHEGRHRGVARPWLGLSPEDRRRVYQRMLQAAQRMAGKPKTGR